MEATEYDPRSAALWFFHRHKPQVNLDVGILGQLATGQVGADMLDQWLHENDGYIALYRYHRMELAKRGEIVVRRVLRFLEQRPAFLMAMDAGTAGRMGRANAIPLVFLPIKPVDNDSRAAFIEGIIEEDIDKVRKDVAEGKEKLLILREALRTFGIEPWEGMPEIARLWILLSIGNGCGELSVRDLHDSDYYSAYKLQMCTFLHRFVYQNTKWRDSDYGDVLHCLDLAYAQFVITERAFAETLRQISAKVPGLAPGKVETIDWLRA